MIKYMTDNLKTSNVSLGSCRLKVSPQTCLFYTKFIYTILAQNH